MIAKVDLEEVLQVAGRNGDFAEVFMERSVQTRVSMEAGKIERVISGRDQGTGIRVVRGENTAYGYTTDLTSKLGEKSASPRNGTGYHPTFVENQ